jgi:hypothetical protein
MDEAKRLFWRSLTIDRGIPYLCSLSEDVCYYTVALLAVCCGLCYPHLGDGLSEFDIATAFMREYRPDSRYTRFEYV